MNTPEYQPFSSISISGFAEEIGQLPLYLSLHETGFATDKDNLYAVRRSVIPHLEIGSLAVAITDGPHKRNLLYENADDCGEYVANHPHATNIPGVKGSTMYVVRIPLADTEILQANTMANMQKRGQRMAVQLDRDRKAANGGTSRRPRRQETSYEAGNYGSFQLRAVSILATGQTVSFGDQKAPPRWAVLRNSESATIVAKGHWQTL